jgi:hypothetical protein
MPNSCAYLLYLGSQLKLPITSEKDQSILQGVPFRWYKQGLFQWIATPDIDTKSQGTVVDQSFESDDLHDFAWLASSGMITYEPEQTTYCSTPLSVPRPRATEDASILIPEEVDDNHAHQSRGRNASGYGTSHGKNAWDRDRYSLPYGEESGFWYRTKKADDGSQALFRLSLFTVNLPKHF